LKANKPAKPKQAALLGLGLDGDDGHTRLTRGKNFVLYGGSDETHTSMQETALEDVSPRELGEIFGEIRDR
jgi:hypothetical protein